MSRKKYPQNEFSIGCRLRLFRESIGQNVSQFSKLLSISQGSLSDIENNKTLPSAKPIANIIQFTDLDVYWLFSGEGKMVRKRPEAGAGQQDNSEKVADLNGIIDEQHMEVVKEFKDKTRAKRINKNLVAIEKVSPSVFKSIDAYIKDKAETVTMTAGDIKKSSRDKDDEGKKIA